MMAKTASPYLRVSLRIHADPSLMVANCEDGRAIASRAMGDWESGKGKGGWYLTGR